MSKDDKVEHSIIILLSIIKSGDFMEFDDILLFGVTILCAIGSVAGWWHSRQAASEASSDVQHQVTIQGDFSPLRRGF